MMVRLTERELGTVLAALRYWQRTLTERDTGPISPDHFSETITPLTRDEIDSLCEHFNLDLVG